jgi:FlaA1/EpsC-like NDP-sugar epimerase
VAIYSPAEIHTLFTKTRKKIVAIAISSITRSRRSEIINYLMSFLERNEVLFFL